MFRTLEKRAEANEIDLAFDPARTARAPFGYPTANRRPPRNSMAVVGPATLTQGASRLDPSATCST
jgi:hypothetical protein